MTLPKNRRAALLITAAVSTAYVLSYPLLSPLVGEGYNAGSIFGVVVAGALLGMKGALWCALAEVLALSMVQAHMYGHSWGGELLDLQTLIGSVALVGVAVVVGGLRDKAAELRSAHAEARQSREQLEAALREAEQARIRAEASEASRGRFLANMSHEMRTPLNGVIGMTHLLLESGLDPGQLELARTANKSARVLLSVINDILDFSKIEAGKLEIERIVFDPREILDEVGAILGVQAREAHLELLCLCDTDVPARIVGDPGRLRQVLLNLTGNAVKFTPHGAVTVQLHRVGMDDQTITLRAEVHDTGIGISPESLPTMFEAFEQSDASTTRRFGGTGLGLAISRQLVRLMGGEIGAESQVGVGSVFWFTLQAGRVADALPHPRAPGIQGLRVLIADDMDIVRRAMVLLLSRWGCETDAAEDVDDAWQKLTAAHDSATPYDVLLCDKLMPGGGGLALGARMAAHPDPGLRDLPRYLLTGLPSPEDEARSRAVGFRALLPKPLHHQTLQDILANILPAPGADADADASADSLAGVRVLLVEDNLINQLVARKYLEQLGCIVAVAQDGEKALSALQADPYDLVLMDCQMPVLDGLEATRRLRAPDSPVLDPAIPVIAMTAGVMVGDREACIAAGMSDYISKPIEHSELRRVLRLWSPPAAAHPSARARTDSFA